MVNTKNNMVTLRVSDNLSNWLDEQGRVLGMNRSEVVRFWLNNSMLTFSASVDVAKTVVQNRLSDVQTGGATVEKA